MDIFNKEDNEFSLHPFQTRVRSCSLFKFSHLFYRLKIVWSSGPLVFIEDLFVINGPLPLGKYNFVVSPPNDSI
jgi:hypothetical protein